MMIRATTPFIYLLKRLSEGGIDSVSVTWENLEDLTDIYIDGRGKDMGVKKPEIGDSMDVGQLLQMVENANHISERMC